MAVDLFLLGLAAAFPLPASGERESCMTLVSIIRDADP